MTIKKQLWQEIESSSDELLLETLDFLQHLKKQKINQPKSHQKSVSTGKSLLEHLNTLPNWTGDDAEECFSSVRQTRSEAQFDESNPFDEDRN